jgi:hypothetical protein
MREAAALVARELMDAEITEEIGAAYGEVCPERVTHRNGYRPRPWETRVGEIELLIPRKRQGPAAFPSSSNPAGAVSRRSSPSCSRPISTASPRARSTGWSSSWGSPG